SAVFVDGDTVWKLKKAVRMPFLDFTTPEARRRFLVRELELNKPAAPGIYQDVVAVARQADGSLALADGEPVDWVLRMARVPADDFLDVVVAQHRLTPELLDDLGDCVFDYHSRLAPKAGWDSVASMRRIADGNVRAAQAAGLPEGRVAAWRAAIGTEIERVAPVLARRAESGMVRRCHGDLHLGNLCLWQGKPVAFDALEFDEDLATIDVAYDLAFLLMDLDLKAGRAAANRVMNRYVGRCGDAGVAACLRLFLSQRAFIRAHVFAAMHDDEAAVRHLDAAEDYLRPSKAHVVALGGLQGTGKTTLARMVAPGLGPAPGALVVRSDETRKRLFGARPEERLGANAYTDEANARTNAALIAQVVEAAGHGHSVIADSTFLAAEMRTELEAAVGRAGVAFTGVWLHAPLAVLAERIQSRRRDASDATVEVLERAASRDDGGGWWHKVDASDAGRAREAIERLVESHAG
ncbi:MAG TPA: AAA family ATPase, partial [Rhodopila sp.]|nr:AAA family ATPase [Rhodopila sp.]